MKSSLFLFGLFISLFLLSCGDADRADAAANEPEITEPTEPEFTDLETDETFNNYLSLRSALVDSDAETAATSASRLAEGLAEEQAQTYQLALAISETSDLEEQRTLFAELTESLEPVFASGITGGTIYKQHCPMAFDGEGGDWFSEVAEIRNPYYGDKMLTCGKVVAEID